MARRQGRGCHALPMPCPYELGQQIAMRARALAGVVLPSSTRSPAARQCARASDKSLSPRQGAATAPSSTWPAASRKGGGVARPWPCCHFQPRALLACVWPGLAPPPPPPDLSRRRHGERKNPCPMAGALVLGLPRRVPCEDPVQQKQTGRPPVWTFSVRACFCRINGGASTESSEAERASKRPLSVAARARPGAHRLRRVPTALASSAVSHSAAPLAGCAPRRPAARMASSALQWERWAGRGPCTRRAELEARSPPPLAIRLAPAG